MLKKKLNLYNLKRIFIFFIIRKTKYVKRGTEIVKNEIEKLILKNVRKHMKSATYNPTRIITSLK